MKDNLDMDSTGNKVLEEQDGDFNCACCNYGTYTEGDTIWYSEKTGHVYCNVVCCAEVENAN